VVCIEYKYAPIRPDRKGISFHWGFPYSTSYSSYNHYFT